MIDAVERDSVVPIYQQLEDIFTAKIASGEWLPSQRIPSENELNRHYGLSRMTVRGVLNKLAADLGKLAAYAAGALADGTIKGEEGDSFTAGDLGDYTVDADATVLLGDPTVFNADNIGDFDF